MAHPLASQLRNLQTLVEGGGREELHRGLPGAVDEHDRRARNVPGTRGQSRPRASRHPGPADNVNKSGVGGLMTATNQPDRSPAPGIIPEPAHVHDDAPTAATKQQDEPRLRAPAHDRSPRDLRAGIRTFSRWRRAAETGIEDLIVSHDESALHPRQRRPTGTGLLLRAGDAGLTGDAASTLPSACVAARASRGLWREPRLSLDRG
jgi:hypothetical protein